MPNREKERKERSPRTPADPREALRDYDENDLEKALKDTFPASDPVAASSPTKAGRPNHGRAGAGPTPPAESRRRKA